jgi:hypothetical protein
MSECADCVVDLENAVKSDRTLLKHYQTINRKFFDGQLPDSTCVRWLSEDEDETNLEDKLFGYAALANDGRHKYQIVLSRKMNGPASTRFTTLVHECIHIATGLRDDHGPAFEKVRQMLSDRGVYKKGALIKGLTIF